jgi:hypothetical protein
MDVSLEVILSFWTLFPLLPCYYTPVPTFDLTVPIWTLLFHCPFHSLWSLSPLGVNWVGTPVAGLVKFPSDQLSALPSAAGL